MNFTDIKIKEEFQLNGYAAFYSFFNTATRAWTL